MRDAHFSQDQNFFTEFPELKKLFIKEARRITLKKGSMVFCEGAPSDECYYIASGEVHESYTSENGKEAPVSIYYKGSLFGFADILAGCVRHCRAVSMRQTTLYAIKRETFLHTLCHHAAFNLKIHEHNSKYRIYSEQRLACMILYNTPGRFIHLLIMLHGMADTAASHSGKPLPICHSQSLLAAMIGSTQSTVSGLLNQLRQEGVLDYRIKYIDVPDLEALWKKEFRQPLSYMWP